MRQKLPPSLERRVLVKNGHCCCICQGDGCGKEVLIHHIDGNNSNNVESNLAVLCLIHASQADAGLRQGKLGAGKKLKPDSVRQYKKIWQRKRRTETLPLRAKKQLEILPEAGDGGWRYYTTDEFFGIRWRWRYGNDGGVYGLVSFCPACDYQVYAADASAYIVAPHISYRCEDCDRTLGEFEGTSEELENRVIRAIQKKIRTFTWPKPTKV